MAISPGLIFGILRYIYIHFVLHVFDRMLIKTLVKFIAVKYNPSLISCNKVCASKYFAPEGNSFNFCHCNHSSDFFVKIRSHHYDCYKHKDIYRRKQYQCGHLALNSCHYITLEKELRKFGDHLHTLK